MLEYASWGVHFGPPGTSNRSVSPSRNPESRAPSRPIRGTQQCGHVLSRSIIALESGRPSFCTARPRAAIGSAHPRCTIGPCFERLWQPQTQWIRPVGFDPSDPAREWRSSARSPSQVAQH